VLEGGAAADAELRIVGERLLPAAGASRRHHHSVASVACAGVTSDRVAAALDRLRADGVRITAARRAVVTAITDATDHLTADEIAAHVAVTNPDVHRSTVYRTLDALERLGVVTHVHLGHGRAVYHSTDRLHHHAYCESCGAVVELPGDALAEVEQRLREETGFQVDSHHFALVGRCRLCGDADRAP
jgi:Fe2+ or Zn2+ uptake regulation protein